MAEAAPSVLERNNFVDQRPFSLNPKQYTQESWSTAYTRPSATAKLLKCTQVWIRLPLWYSTRPVLASSARRLSQQNEKFLFQQSRKFLFETGKLAG